MDRYTLIMTIITILAAIERALQADVKFAPTLDAPWRGLVVAVMGMVGTPVLDAWLNGSGVATAALSGLLAILPTVIAALTGLLGNKDVQRKMAAAAGASVLLLVLGSGSAACTGAGAVTCAVVHAADVACPYIFVQLADGGTEAIPRDGIVRQAEAQRRARADEFGSDGGR